jgi:hypothetical protein
MPVSASGLPIDNNPNGNGSQLGWKNKLASLTPTITVNGATNPNLGYIFDSLSTTFFSIDPVVNIVDFEFEFIDLTDINYFGLSGVNWNTAGCLSVEFYQDVDGIYEVVDIIDASAYTNRKLCFELFNPVISTKFKLRFNCSNNLVINEMHLGRSLEFPTTPNVGYKPAKWSNAFSINKFISETNAFGGTITKEILRKEECEFQLVPYEFMNEEWAVLLNEYRGEPVFFCWNKKEFPDDIILIVWVSYSI